MRQPRLRYCPVPAELRNLLVLVFFIRARAIGARFQEKLAENLQPSIARTKALAIPRILPPGTSSSSAMIMLGKTIYPFYTTEQHTDQLNPSQFVPV